MPNILKGFDCPHCDAAETLEHVWTEMGTKFCTCTCCGKSCRVDYGGRVHKAEQRKTDVSGNEMFEP